MDGIVRGRIEGDKCEEMQSWSIEWRCAHATHDVAPRLEYPRARQAARDVPRLPVHDRRGPCKKSTEAHRSHAQKC